MGRDRQEEKKGGNMNGEEEGKERKRNQRLVAVTLSGTRPHRGAPWLAHTSLASHHIGMRWEDRGNGDRARRWEERERERKKLVGHIQVQRRRAYSPLIVT